MLLHLDFIQTRNYCFYVFIAKKQVKRQFVTTHQLQQQKMNKKANQVDKAGKRNSKNFPLEGTRKSPRLSRVQEITDGDDCETPPSVRRKLSLHDTHEDERMGENELEVSI